MELPKEFINKYEKLLGKEAPEFFTALKKEFQKGFRLNELKILNKETVAKEISLDSPTPYSPNGYYGVVSGKTPLHQGGWVYSQEISAMIVAEVADITPGDKVLDLCAAPGGKSTRLGEKLKGEGVLVANEIFPKRAKILSENIERYGLENVLVTNHAPQELVPHFKNYFDVVVVDAPCSGEGMFQKEPQALTQWSQDYVLTCQKRQKEILRAAKEMLKENGELVYSTCTFAPEENEEIMDFLLETGEFELLSIEGEFAKEVSHGRKEFSKFPKEIEKTIRLWPHINKGAGHFVAKLRKISSEDMSEIPVKKNKKKKTKSIENKMTKEENALWEAFYQKFPLPLKGGHFEMSEKHLWYVPDMLPSLKGLHYLRKGLYLGEFLKNRFVPSYSLALAIKDYHPYPHLVISKSEWQDYVKGQTLTKEGNLGFVLLVCGETIVSFGKQTQGIVKNYFPKGLRIQHV